MAGLTVFKGDVCVCVLGRQCIWGEFRWFRIINMFATYEHSIEMVMVSLPLPLYLLCRMKELCSSSNIWCIFEDERRLCILISKAILLESQRQNVDISTISINAKASGVREYALVDIKDYCHCYPWHVSKANLLGQMYLF